MDRPFPRLLDRRNVLQLTAGGFASLTATSRLSRAQPGADSAATIEFTDQQLDGQTLTVAEVTTTVAADLVITDSGGQGLATPVQLDADETRRDLTVELDQPIEKSQRLTAALQAASGRIAEDTAFVSVSEDAVVVDGVGITLVSANPDAGFNYPYYLFAPHITEQDPVAPTDERPILVEPNNSGQVADEFEIHRRAAETRVKTGFPRQVVDELLVPLLIPVFPRPRSSPVDATHYVHQLDTETMHIDEGKLERIDRQLLRMFEDARARLDSDGYPVAEEFIMNGFSASGTFVNRFAALHPDRVISVTAGGINGMTILPIEQAKGETLNYQIGIADLESLIGEPFDLTSFKAVNQFLYMGELDGNDTILATDAWSDEQRQIALDVYGVDMHDQRFPYCQTVYESVGVGAQFKVYDLVGHNPFPALEDVVEFHRRSIAGEDVSSFGEDLGSGGGEGAPPEAAFEYQPSNPTAGEPVAFDASGSTTPADEFISFTWDYADGETDAGRTATHRFAEGGQYSVTLTVADSRGQTATLTKQVTVDARSETQTETDTGTTSESSPTAAFEFQPTQPAAGQSVRFDASASHTPADTFLSFTWDFGDGSTAAGVEPTHEFSAKGEYAVSLSVADSNGRTDTQTTTIEVRPSSSPASEPGDQSSATSGPPTTAGQAETSAQTPGFGLLTALSGIAAAIGYRVYRQRAESGPPGPLPGRGISNRTADHPIRMQRRGWMIGSGAANRPSGLS